MREREREIYYNTNINIYKIISNNETIKNSNTIEKVVNLSKLKNWTYIQIFLLYFDIIKK